MTRRSDQRHGQDSSLGATVPVRSAGVWYLAVAVVLIAFALRLNGLDVPSIWWDEGHSIQMASAPLVQIPTLPGMDVHPPGYFAMLHQWMAIAGRSEFALRYLSVLFSVLTVALVVRFGRDLTSAKTALAVGGLAALSPLYVAYAQEVRMYAVVTLFALASVYFQWRVITQPPPRGKKMAEEGAELPPPGEKTAGEGVNSFTYPLTPSLAGRGNSLAWPLAAYVLATAATLYTHYFTIFLLVFQNLAWLAWALVPYLTRVQRRGRLAAWIGTQLATLILFLPQLSLALRQTTAYANPNLNPPGVGEFLSRSWLAYTVGVVVDPFWGNWLGGAVAVILGVALLARLVDAFGGADGVSPMRRRHVWVTVTFFLAWFIIPLGAYFLVLQRRPSFEPRYMMLVTPALVLLLGWGMASPWPTLSERGRATIRRWLSVVGYLMVLAIWGWGTWSYFANIEDRKDDSAGVAAWLAVETTANDIVYVDVPHPFHYYADRIPAPTRYLFVDVHTAADILNAEAVGKDRLFWVTWWGSDTDPRGVVPFLLDKVGRKAGEVDFRGYHVSWWDVSSAQGDTPFSLPNDLSPADVVFGDLIHLDGMAFSPTARVEGSAWVTLHLELLRDTDIDYRVSLRLRGPDGNMLSPTDKDLLNDRHFRTSAWPLDDPLLNQTINVYVLPVPSDNQPGDYHLEAVVYDATTLEALSVTGVSTPDGISALLGTISVSP